MDIPTYSADLTVSILLDQIVSFWDGRFRPHLDRLEDEESLWSPRRGHCPYDQVPGTATLETLSPGTFRNPRILASTPKHRSHSTEQYDIRPQIK